MIVIFHIYSIGLEKKEEEEYKIDAEISAIHKSMHEIWIMGYCVRPKRCYKRKSKDSHLQKLGSTHLFEMGMDLKRQAAEADANRKYQEAMDLYAAAANRLHDSKCK